MIYIIIFSSVPASAKPRSSHKPQPSHSSLTGSTRAPGAVQNACFKHTFRQMSPFGDISNTCRWTRGRGDLAHACSPLVAEEGHYIWSGGVSCQITIISSIWWNETHHKEVYKDEVGWKWAVWSHRGRWETDPVLCVKMWAEACMPSFSDAFSSLAGRRWM